MSDPVIDPARALKDALTGAEKAEEECRKWKASAAASDENADAWRQRAIEHGWKPTQEWEGWEKPLLPPTTQINAIESVPAVDIARIIAYETLDTMGDSRDVHWSSQSSRTKDNLLATAEVIRKLFLSALTLEKSNG